jgi:hypothetical protein
MYQSTPGLPARHFEPRSALQEDVRDFLEGPWFDEAPLLGRRIDVKKHLDNQDLVYPFPIIR